MAERYVTLNGKYLEEADRLLEAGDYVRASEKYWGAVAEMVKAVAESRGLRHSSHRDLRTVVSRIHEETGDDDILRFFSEAESLHANFYENFMSPNDLRVYAQDAHGLIQKLSPLVTR